MEYFEDRAAASDISPRGSPMRVLLCLALTLLIAIPACFAFVVLFALGTRRSVGPSS
jgi:hypothetical protein